MPAPLFRSLIAFAAIALGAFMLFALASSAYHATPSDLATVSDEPVTQDVGNWTAVDAADDPAATEFYENETVRVGGTPLDEGTDYEWNSTNASIYWYNTVDTTDGGSATVDYAYREHSETDARIHELVSIPVGSVGLFVLAPVITFIGALFVWLSSLLLKARRSTAGGGR